MAPLVLDLLRRVNESVAAAGAAAAAGGAAQGVPQAVLFKVAAYNAAAVAAYELHDYIDFAAWLRSGLLPEIRLAGLGGL